MDAHDTILEAQADWLAEAALKELGETPLDEPDEYAEQCEYAGCYPWLQDVICAHPYERTIHPVVSDGDSAENPDCYF